MCNGNKPVSARVIRSESRLVAIRKVIFIDEFPDLLNINFSKILEQMVRKTLVGSYFLSTFLCTGIMLPFFKSSGKILCWRQLFYIIDRSLVFGNLQNFSIHTEIPSWAWAFCGFNFLISFKMFPQSISKSLSLFCVYNIWFVGRMLLIAIGWHCWTKKSLKTLACSLKLEIRLFLTNNDEIIGFFCH